jgi:hypothetical protein
VEWFFASAFWVVNHINDRGDYSVLFALMSRIRVERKRKFSL